MEILIILLILIIILLAYKQIESHLKNKNSIEPSMQVPSEIPLEPQMQYPYKKKMLLTKTEYSFYRILKTECDKHQFLICPKVRMEDFLEVTSKDEKLKYRGYIKSRHIDFMICDKNLNIICGIELDDQYHNNAKVQKTDEFKNKVFEQIKLPLHRIKVGKENYTERIKEILNTLDNKEIPLQEDK